MRDLLRASLAAAHVASGAAWLGAMLYSLVVVQPRAERFFGGSEEYEAFAVTLAAGARWKVMGVAAVLALSGAGLVLTQTDEADPSTLWVGLMVAKAVLLAVAVGLFAYVSWWLWPARVFAAPAELAVWQRRTRALGAALTGVVGSGLLLGSVAGSLR